MPVPSVEDIWNQVLRELGVRRRIGSAYDGSEASKAFLEVYGETRDELLRSMDWDFARRSIALTLLKGPPPPGGYNPQTPWNSTYPPPGWLYEYGYPSDALELRAIVPQPFLLPNRDPKPALWRIDNDFTLGGGGEILTGGGQILTGADNILIGGSGGPLASGTKVILANVRNAIAIYLAQVIDPSQWNVSFLRVLITSLKEKLAVPLSQNLDLMKSAAQESAVDAAMADKRRG